MTLSETRKGELYTFAQAIAGALLPVVVVLSYRSLSPLASLAWNTLFAAAFLVFVLLYRGTYRDLLHRALWRNCALVALFMSVFYVFFFAALELTTPGNVAIMMLFEVFTSYLFFRIFFGETVSKNHVFGALLTVVGAAIVLFKDFSGINVGSVLVIVGVLFAPAGNYFQQRARQLGSAEAVLFLRYILSLPIFFGLAQLFGRSWTIVDVQTSLIFLFVSGFFIFGFSKLWWIESIHRIPVPKAIALSEIAPFATLLFAWVILGQRPDSWQLVSLVPLVLGTLLLSDQLRIRR